MLDLSVSILYKYHISLDAFLESLSARCLVSILYKYHISQASKRNRSQRARNMCRSFISIIFPRLQKEIALKEQEICVDPL